MEASPISRKQERRRGAMLPRSSTRQKRRFLSCSDSPRLLGSAGSRNSSCCCGALAQAIQTMARPQLQRPILRFSVIGGCRRVGHRRFAREPDWRSLQSLGIWKSAHATPTPAAKKTIVVLSFALVTCCVFRPEELKGCGDEQCEHSDVDYGHDCKNNPEEEYPSVTVGTPLLAPVVIFSVLSFLS